MLRASHSSSNVVKVGTHAQTQPTSGRGGASSDSWSLYWPPAAAVSELFEDLLNGFGQVDDVPRQPVYFDHLNDERDAGIALEYDFSRSFLTERAQQNNYSLNNCWLANGAEHLDRITLPVKELTEDVGPCSALALCAAIAPQTALVVGGKAVITLCGLTVHTKGVYTFLGALMAGGSWALWHRYPQEPDRVVQKRSAAALAICGCAHIFMVAGFGIPPQIAVHLAHPEIVAHFVTDMMVMPLIVANLGYIAGQRTDDMRTTLLCTSASTASFLAAAAIGGNHALACFAVGGAALCKVIYDLDYVLPGKARSVSEINKIRVALITDLLVMCWSSVPLVEGLNLLGLISVPTCLHTFAILDAIGKFGTCHLMLNPKSEMAVKNARETLIRQGFNTGSPAG